MPPIDILKSLTGQPQPSCIPEAFSLLAKNSPQEIVYSQAHVLSDGKREWRTADYAEVSRKVWKLAHFLQASGVKPGDKVAIMSSSRPEWMIADLALLYAGATSVSIYQSVTAQETGYILFDSGASFIFAENEEQTKKLTELRQNPCPIPATEERAASQERLKIGKVVTFEKVGDPAATLLSDIFSDKNLPEAEPQFTSTNEIASLVYTSGTTGPPKGVIQTHLNHLANLWQASQTGLFAPRGEIFLFLPLAHSFARLIGYIGFLTPTIVKFPAIADPQSSALNAPSMLKDLSDGSPQVVPMVPRILEKLMDGVQEKSRAPGLAAKLLRLTLLSHKACFEAKTSGKNLPLRLRLVKILTRPLQKKIKRSLFGPKFLHIVSGGAKLPVVVNEFFSGLDIRIFEGYGLTETCVATNVNLIEKNKIGSVGPCLKGVELKIESDEEILFRGPNIARGYYNRPTATKAAWDGEGWFHTGDLGRVDEQGFLFITGRKKELIVTSGGKKISPLMIEEKLTNSPFISSAVVLGDGRQYCVALIVLDGAAVKQWAARHGVESGTAQSPSFDVHARVQKDIDDMNETLSRFETIKKFRVIDVEPTIENGLLTPTFKLKRGLVEKRFKSLVDEMYGE